DVDRFLTTRVGDLHGDDLHGDGPHGDGLDDAGTDLWAEDLVEGFASDDATGNFRAELGAALDAERRRFTEALDGWRQDNQDATLPAQSAADVAAEYLEEVGEQFSDVFGGLGKDAFDPNAHPDAWQDWEQRIDDLAGTLPARFDAHARMDQLAANVAATANRWKTDAWSYRDEVVQKAVDNLGEAARDLYDNLVGALATAGGPAGLQQAKR